MRIPESEIFSFIFFWFLIDFRFHCAGINCILFPGYLLRHSIE